MKKLLYIVIFINLFILTITHNTFSAQRGGAKHSFEIGDTLYANYYSTIKAGGDSTLIIVVTSGGANLVNIDTLNVNVLLPNTNDTIQISYGHVTIETLFVDTLGARNIRGTATNYYFPAGGASTPSNTLPLYGDFVFVRPSDSSYTRLYVGNNTQYGFGDDIVQFWSAVNSANTMIGKTTAPVSIYTLWNGSTDRIYDRSFNNLESQFIMSGADTIGVVKGVNVYISNSSTGIMGQAYGIYINDMAGNVNSDTVWAIYVAGGNTYLGDSLTVNAPIILGSSDVIDSVKAIASDTGDILRALIISSIGDSADNRRLEMADTVEVYTKVNGFSQDNLDIYYSFDRDAKDKSSYVDTTGSPYSYEHNDGVIFGDYAGIKTSKDSFVCGTGGLWLGGDLATSKDGQVNMNPISPCSTFTIMAWINTSYYNSVYPMTIFSSDSTTAYPAIYLTRASGTPPKRLVFGMYNGTTPSIIYYDFPASYNGSTMGWRHLAVTYDYFNSQKAVMYLDGEVVAQGSLTPPNGYTYWDNPKIGKGFASNFSNWVGLIDEFKYYSKRALTSQEIKNDYLHSDIFNLVSGDVILDQWYDFTSGSLDSLGLFAETVSPESCKVNVKEYVWRNALRDSAMSCLQFDNVPNVSTHYYCLSKTIQVPDGYIHADPDSFISFQSRISGAGNTSLIVCKQTSTDSIDYGANTVANNLAYKVFTGSSWNTKNWVKAGDKLTFQWTFGTTTTSTQEAVGFRLRWIVRRP